MDSSDANAFSVADNEDHDQTAAVPCVRHNSQFNPGKIVKGAFPIIREYNSKTIPQEKVRQCRREFNLPNTEVPCTPYRRHVERLAL
jgi:hypothetical protein